MTAQADRSAGRAAGPRQQQLRRADNSLDGLVKGLAGDGISRGQALKMIGGALAGAALALLPRAAQAETDLVDFGSEGPVDGRESDNRPYKVCCRQSDFPPGCPCSVWMVGNKFFQACTPHFP